MANNTKNGKALEYAVLLSFVEGLKNITPIENTQYFSAKKHFEEVDSKTTSKYLAVAKTAFSKFLELEPKLNDSNEEFSIQIPSDQAAIKADVRDIIISNKKGWEFGISVKNNHNAYKHSRLSKKDNFAEKWLNLKSSDKYIATIKPIFDELELLKKQDKKWNELQNKAARFYKPLLDSFTTELEDLLENAENDVGKKLIEYIIGKDHYKLVHTAGINTIYAFNIAGTLSKGCDPILIPKLPLPTKTENIYSSTKKNGVVSDNTIIIDMDNGWELSFRLHNAESKVVPSLKWDIQPKSYPKELYTYTYTTNEAED